MWYTKFSAMHSLPPKRILLWYTSKCNCIYVCQKSTAFSTPILVNTYGVISLNKIVIRNALTTSNLTEIIGWSLNRTGCVGHTSYFSVQYHTPKTHVARYIISNNTARWHNLIITKTTHYKINSSSAFFIVFKTEWKIVFRSPRKLYAERCM